MPDVLDSQLLDQARRILSGLLAEKRSLAGMTIRHAADRLQRNKTWLSRIETGTRKVSMDELVALSKLYGVEPGELLNEAAKILNPPADC